MYYVADFASTLVSFNLKITICFISGYNSWGTNFDSVVIFKIMRSHTLYAFGIIFFRIIFQTIIYSLNWSALV
jgi:hypothetical protein